jgi:antitoxin (DNA-binding transcriptional repressor) of toxin-antitoxin stability system
MVMKLISKAQLKPHLLAYLREVELHKTPLIVTHGGKPVITISPFQEDPDKALTALRGTVVLYKDPFDSVGQADWEALK